jgi:hypothetical protein
LTSFVLDINHMNTRSHLGLTIIANFSRQSPPKKLVERFPNVTRKFEVGEVAVASERDQWALGTCDDLAGYEVVIASDNQARDD